MCPAPPELPEMHRAPRKEGVLPRKNIESNSEGGDADYAEAVPGWCAAAQDGFEENGYTFIVDFRSLFEAD